MTVLNKHKKLSVSLLGAQSILDMISRKEPRNIKEAQKFETDVLRCEMGFPYSNISFSTMSLDDKKSFLVHCVNEQYGSILANDVENFLMVNNALSSS